MTVNDRTLDTVEIAVAERMVTKAQTAYDNATAELTAAHRRVEDTRKLFERATAHITTLYSKPVTPTPTPTKPRYTYDIFLRDHPDVTVHADSAIYKTHNGYAALVLYTDNDDVPVAEFNRASVAGLTRYPAED